MFVVRTFKSAHDDSDWETVVISQSLEGAVSDVRQNRRVNVWAILEFPENALFGRIVYDNYSNKRNLSENSHPMCAPLDWLKEGF